MALAMYVGTLLLIPLLYVLNTLIAFMWTVYKIRTALLRDFPVPEYHWLFGHLKIFPGFSEEGLLWYSAMTARFPRYYVGLLGPFARLQLNHPETIKQLTKTTAPKQHGIGGAYLLTVPWIGYGLLLSSGSKWFRNRKLLTPGFHFDVLKPYLKIYNNCVETLMDKFEKQSTKQRKSVEIYKPVSLCTLDIVLSCAFSYDQGVQDEGENQTYVQTVNALGRLLVNRALQPHHWFDFVYYRTVEGKQFQQNCDYSHQVAREVIEKRQTELKNYETVQKLSTKRHVDFLDILLLAKDDQGHGLTSREIMDEVETFMFAGHDTTTSGISWALYNLARHPEIQQTAREEVDALLDGRHSDRIEWADLNELPFLTRCIKESLRLHTVVPLIGRQLTQPLQLDGKIIPAGTLVDIHLWNLHHNPEVWENPMTYDPDRFLQEKMANMDSHAFMPFSAGPRNCIGQIFAMNEMKTTIARILRRFEISVDTKRKATMHPDAVLRAKNGIYLFFNSAK